MNFLPIIIVAGIAVALHKINGGTKRKQVDDAIRAMKRVLQTRKDAPSALYREEIGTIGFRYGAHYPATKARKRSGHGLAHVIGSAREDFGKYAGSPSPEEVLQIIPEVILDGKISRADKGRVNIIHRGHLVLLSQGGKREDSTRWLFHAYKLYPHQKK